MGRDDRRAQTRWKAPFRHWFLQGTQRFIAGWSSPVARQAHNLKVIGSNPIPATKLMKNPSDLNGLLGFSFGVGIDLNNINNLACRFKSPRHHTHNRVRARNLADRKLTCRRGVDIFITFDPRNFFWQGLVVQAA